LTRKDFSRARCASAAAARGKIGAFRAEIPAAEGDSRISSE
jgi:hypothetical protein